MKLSTGMPAKFEISLRLVPKIGKEDVKGRLLGVGLKKEITSWFGPLGVAPLHLSLLVAHTTMNVEYDIQRNDDISVQNGFAEFKLNSYTVQAIASLNFPILNL